MVGTGLLVGLASGIVRRATVVELFRRRREVARLADGAERDRQGGSTGGPGLPQGHGGGVSFSHVDA